MRSIFLFIAAIMAILLVSCSRFSETENTKARESSINATAIPLIAHDPYFSCWSFSNNLNEQTTLHWTGKPYPLNGLIKVDDNIYRFMGMDEYKMVIPTSMEEEYVLSYTTQDPGKYFMNPDYNDNTWESGPAPLVNRRMEERGNTVFDNDTVWVRREFELNDTKNLMLKIMADGTNVNGMMVYVNGIKSNAFSQQRNNMVFPFSENAAASLKPGKNVIAIKYMCRREFQPIFIDFGIAKKEPLPKARQIFSQMTSTQSYYGFECGPVALDLKFTSPLIMDDLEMVSRPLSYISYKIYSLDDQSHDVKVYFDTSPLWAVDDTEQEVEWEMYEYENTSILKTGTVQQPVLQKSGDNVLIDWGYHYLITENKEKSAKAILPVEDLHQIFIESGNIPEQVDKTMPRPAGDDPLALAVVHTIDGLTSDPVIDFIALAYDDLYSIEYFGKKLRAWWKKDGKTAEEMIVEGINNYKEIMKNADAFDKDLYQVAFDAGGEKYAELCVLAYRQAVSAHKLVSDNGFPLFLSKENFSNGSLGTVDVTYPSAPLFLYYSTDLVKGMLEPIFYYSESGKWNKPFAAHDVGKYPIANGQKYPEDMPVEECGNMIILTAAISKVDGNADYASSHWKTLTQWAEYLAEKGFDPENQLCTDDFAGHLAHNANLSVKAIIALKAYAEIALMLEKQEIYEKYSQLASGMVDKWIIAAQDGDHFSLTFDRKGTWSQKYNLVWDGLLGFDIFPDSIVDMEIQKYLEVQNRFGLPLDSRADYTKSDWIVWSATMADDENDFHALINPLYQSVNQSYNKQPLTDWYDTKTGMVTGFRARSVVGGFYMKMLAEKLVDK